MAQAQPEHVRLEQACAEMARTLFERGSPSKKEFAEVRKRVSLKYGLERMPRNSAILSELPPAKRKALEEVLRVKPVRTASGVAVIAAMTKPYPCPHGSCVFCPGGERLGTPQSYTPGEPATKRGLQNHFEPYEQIVSRINQLSAAGHRVGKVELIIKGGTYPSLPAEYQREFVKGCFDALNGRRSTGLEEAMKTAEDAQIRNVGLTVETKPDYCRREHVDLMLSYGVTRVEVGVQALDDRVYRLVNRGHTVKDVVEALQVAKDAGLKVITHMMPGLPGSSPEKDLKDFIRLFDDPQFKPDMLKVYPTLVVASTGLYGWYIKGRYEPHDEDTVVRLIAEVKRHVPRWLRINRIQREIPAQEIVAGVKSSNLRELVREEMARRGYACKCIRCREVGLKQLKHGIAVKDENIVLLRQDYQASDGVEVFLSYEDVVNDALIGFLRLRVPSEKAHRPEVNESRSCLIRELHVYGPTVPVGLREQGSWQHRGYGRLLMAEAERLAREEFDAEKILVISAVGTREYYRRLGYALDGPYMAKRL